jgi:hypothetical protein
VKLFCGAKIILGVPVPGDFLANNYSFTGWPNIFNGAASDVVVPLASAGFNQPIKLTFGGVVHGPGTVGFGPTSDPHIGFAGPQLLDPASGAPVAALVLLNTNIKDSHFVDTPGGH